VSLASSTLRLGLDYAAIVLTGGRSSRLGGTPKAALASGGRPLVDVVLDAVRDARMRVVVGDGPVPPGVLVTQEQPRYAGPAAAVAAGLRALRGAEVTSPWTVVLACDLPGVRDGIPLLVSAATRAEAPEDREGVTTRDGWCLSEDGRLQWLFAIVRTAALARAVDALGDPRNRSMGALMGSLDLGGIPAPAAVTADIDTWEDAHRWLRP